MKLKKNIEKITEKADFSVVNAMSKQSHPCEILSDLQTIRERRGNLNSLKIVFVGEGANISNTWFEAAAKLNLNLTQACPEGYEVNNELFQYAKDNSINSCCIK
jgi:ornithine carbamoyltransferase